MYSTLAKRFVCLISLFALVSLACAMTLNVSPSASPAATLPIEIADSPTRLPSTLEPGVISTEAQPALEGVEFTFHPVRIVVPPHLASGVRGLLIARAEGENVVPWEVDPGHVELHLDGYLLQDKFHEPAIYVFPAQAYGELYPAAFESIHRLDNILYVPGGPTLNDQLPFAPFFNAAQIFASNVEVMSFQGGQGVRFVTEYAQYAASANNHDLLYEFQGLTRDGTYYIVAILPINAPMLAETGDAASVLPLGGIAYPYFAGPEADMETYYSAVVDLLNTTAPEEFTPTVHQLDALIESMRITP